MIYALNSSGTPEALKEVHCTDEVKELQSILEKNFGLLAGEQMNPDDERRWLLVKREIPVLNPASGQVSRSLDFLFADQDAVPTLVECKRFRDDAARLKVVGQMLDYAANGQSCWKKEELQNQASETAKKRGVTLDKAVEELNGTGELSSAGLFFDRFYANLQQGKIRIVFFLERSSFELRSIAAFLNNAMKLAEVWVVEARQYDHEGRRFIVPALIGYADQVRLTKITMAEPPPDKPVLTRETLVSMIREKSDLQGAELAEEMIDRLEAMELASRGFRAQVNWGVENDGDFLPIVGLTATGVWFQIPRRVSETLGQDFVTQFKTGANEVAPFFKDESLPLPLNEGACGPRYQVLTGKLDAFLATVRKVTERLRNNPRKE